MARTPTRVVPVDAQPRSSSDPFIGTWKVNIERSTYAGVRPPADQLTLYSFAPMPDGSTRFTLVTANGLGGWATQVSVFRVDGRPYKVHHLTSVATLMSTGTDTNVTRSYRQIDANTVEFTGYTDGQPGDPVIRQLQAGGNSYVQRPANGEGTVLLLERIQQQEGSKR
jgi:hypothetical protein